MPHLNYFAPIGAISRQIRYPSGNQHECQVSRVLGMGVPDFGTWRVHIGYLKNTRFSGKNRVLGTGYSSGTIPPCSREVSFLVGDSVI